MKVTFLAYNIYGVGGTVRTIVNTANELVKNGHDVEIISVKRTSPRPTFALDRSVKLRPLLDARKGKLYHAGMKAPVKWVKRFLLKRRSVLIDKTEDLYPLFSLFTDIQLYRVLKRLKTDVFVTTIPSFNLLSAKWVDPKIKRIGQEHSQFNVHSQELQAKMRQAYPKLDAMMLLSEEEMAAYAAEFGERLRLYRVENATEMPDVRSTLDKKVILSAGRISHEKGFDRLIEAFDLIKDDYPDWQLHIYGDGEEKPALRELIFERECYNQVFLHPKTNALPRKMQDASIYALASRYESFGMVLIEAMALGVPCVSFDIKGPAAIITHETDGLLAPEGDIEAFAAQLRRLIESDELRHRLAEGAVRRSRDYSTEVIGQKWETLLHEVAPQAFKKKR
ncbi:glycosyltransferase family 4 protein [Exiguobacterium flavidum]|uniref:glycosyltransferase family 4 protein n=1 Tax=Exiguobacterium flavidum TaxID=2184695 RepID=UPI000DF7E42B|nr:glycosyltransferase family 4 protein [Exiguobacterium flavidum]